MRNTKFETMLAKEEKADKKCRGCGITYPNENLEKITLGNCYLKLCPRCYSEFSKQFINRDKLDEEIEKAFHSSDDLIGFYWFVKQIIKEALEGRPPGKPIIRLGDDMSSYYICSECHKPIDSWDLFCKHCGARMKNKHNSV